MNEAHEQFQEVFNKLHTFTLSDKMKYLENLLFYFTIAGRGIWSDEISTEAEKIEAFKWLNELIHRIWNIQFKLKQGEDNDFVNRLYKNMKFYGENSNLLRKHLVPTTLDAFKNFKGNQQ